MDNPRTAKLHLELDVEFDGSDAVQAYARQWAHEQAVDDAESLAAKLAQAAESPESALMMVLEPDDILGEVPGVMALGASMWIDGGSEEDPSWSDEAELDEELDFDDEDEESDEDWRQRIFSAADKLPGLDLAALGYATAELNPDTRAQALLEATNLRGALHWAYEYVIDQLFDDVQTLRTSADSLEETLQLCALPPADRSHFDALFAQRFLVVALDLGNSLVSGFSSPSCLAQELALKLLLDSVESLEVMLPDLELPQDWRALASENLFTSLDHELLYLSNDGAADISDWFTPYLNKTLNPYAANE
ncbi:hypothetical protein [Arthrobacter psychrolactophilus]